LNPKYIKYLPDFIPFKFNNDRYIMYFKSNLPSADRKLNNILDYTNLKKKYFKLGQSKNP